MEEKCFCHLNGYKVKDAEARNTINTIKNSIGEMKNLNTEDKTNLVNAINEVANNSGGNTETYPIYKMSSIWDNLDLGGSSSNNLISDTQIVNILTEFINNVVKQDNKTGVLHLISLPTEKGTFAFSYTADFMPIKLNGNETKIYLYSKVQAFGGEGRFERYKQLAFQYYNISLNWENGVCNITDVRLYKNDLDGYGMYSNFATEYFVNNNYLNKNNTTSYTPTNPYNPATKKYVDDAVANISGGGGSGSTIDLSNYYTKEETNGLLNNKVDNSTFESELANKVDTSTFESELANKVNTSTFESGLANKVDNSTFENGLANKVDTSTYNSKISEIENNVNNLTNSSHNVLSGTTQPATSVGNDGDIYIMYE